VTSESRNADPQSRECVFLYEPLAGPEPISPKLVRWSFGLVLEDCRTVFLPGAELSDDEKREPFLDLSEQGWIRYHFAESLARGCNCVLWGLGRPYGTI
jgi:hypothetical protein